jgi:regulator of sigma E protease
LEAIFSIAKSVIVFALLLGVLVVVHEFGHFTMARWMRMKVYEFAFGFGPVLKRLFVRNGTEFNIRVVPLGGFVRIAGMDPGESEEVEGGFNTKPIWQRALVIFAGPFMSLVLGYVVLTMMGFFWGLDVNTSAVADVTKGTPAAKAGLLKGDVVVAVNGRRIDDGWVVNKLIGLKSGDGYLLRRAILGSRGKTLDLTVVRGSEQRVLHVTPRLDKVSGRLVIGIGLWDFYEVKHPTIGQTVAMGTLESYRGVDELVTTILSKRIWKEAGGVVAIGYVTHKTVQSKYAVEGSFGLLAMLSLMLGVVNLIPWPILDGGHLVYLAIEKVRGRRLDPEVWYRVQAAGLAVLMFLMVLLMFRDAVNIHAGKLG